MYRKGYLYCCRKYPVVGFPWGHVLMTSTRTSYFLFVALATTQLEQPHFSQTLLHCRRHLCWLPSLSLSFSGAAADEQGRSPPSLPRSLSLHRTLLWHSFPDREKEENSRTEQRGREGGREGLYISPQLFLPRPSIGGLSLDPKKAAVERLSEWEGGREGILSIQTGLH